MSRLRYTEEQLIELLHTLRDRVGRTPTASDTHDYRDIPTYATYAKRFGSWRNAFEAAGMETDPGRFRYYNREILLARLQALAIELDRTPRRKDLQEAGGPWPETYVRHFGSWEVALRELGMESDSRPGQRYDREYLLEALQDVARELGRAPTYDEMKSRDDVPRPRTYRRRFGSWREALRVAGFPTKPDTRRYDRELLLQELNRIVEELGRTPSGKEVREMGGPSANTFAHHFGSWTAALKELGLTPRTGGRCRDYDDEELLGALRQLAVELGHAPTISEMKARSDLPAASTFQRRFGTWNEALRAAGLTSTHGSRRAD